MLPGLLNIDVEASSNGKGRGDVSALAEDDDEELEESEEEDEDEVEDAELDGEAEDEDDPFPESEDGDSCAGWAAAMLPELSLRTSMSLVSWTGLASRLTRSNCLVKCVMASGACRSSAANCDSCSTSVVHEGIVGELAGRAAASTEPTSSG